MHRPISAGARAAAASRCNLVTLPATGAAPRHAALVSSVNVSRSARSFDSRPCSDARGNIRDAAPISSASRDPRTTASTPADAANRTGPWRVACAPEPLRRAVETPHPRSTPAAMPAAQPPVPTQTRLYRAAPRAPLADLAPPAQSRFERPRFRPVPRGSTPSRLSHSFTSPFPECRTCPRRRSKPASRVPAHTAARDAHVPGQLRYAHTHSIAIAPTECRAPGRVCTCHVLRRRRPGSNLEAILRGLHVYTVTKQTKTRAASTGSTVSMPHRALLASKSSVIRCRLVSVVPSSCVRV